MVMQSHSYDVFNYDVPKFNPNATLQPLHPYISTTLSLHRAA